MEPFQYSKVYVEITNICNKNCSFCHGHHRAPKQMSQEEFLHILEQLKGKTNYVYYHLMGEPFTHPQLPAFLETAAKMGFRSILTTNGTLLERRGEEILKAGIHKINISVHSFEENERSDYEKYLDQIAAFAKKASQGGVIVVLRFWNREYDEGRNDLAVQYLKSVINGDWVENTRGLRIRDKLFLEWGDRFAWPDMGAEVQGDQFFCYGLKDHFGILCDGTVVPCCLDAEGVISLGNVFRQDLSEILNTTRARAIPCGFEKRQAVEELCRKCGYAQRFV